jgi:hypothetical protein
MRGNGNREGAVVTAVRAPGANVDMRAAPFEFHRADRNKAGGVAGVTVASKLFMTARLAWPPMRFSAPALPKVAFERFRGCVGAPTVIGQNGSSLLGKTRQRGRCSILRAGSEVEEGGRRCARNAPLRGKLE